jgi:hypothetical protein
MCREAEGRILCRPILGGLVCAENLIRVDDLTESPKLAE